MKYIRNKLSVEVSDWRNNQSEYLRILAFVHDVFHDIGHPIVVDIPTPRVKFTQFHWNTCRYRFDINDPSIIYLSDKDYGKDLHAALITALFSYFANQSYPNDSTEATQLKMEALEGLEIKFTLGEIAFTSAAVVGGVLAAKSVLRRIF